MRLIPILAISCFLLPACASTSGSAKSETAPESTTDQESKPPAPVPAVTPSSAEGGRHARGQGPRAISGVPVLDYRLACGGQPVALDRATLDRLAACWPTGPTADTAERVTLQFEVGAVGISGVPIAHGPEAVTRCVEKALSAIPFPGGSSGEQCALELGPPQ
jgi:hypothetical protein